MSKLITLDNLATFKEQIDTVIGDSFAANDAMVFKGTLGTNGTVTALPTAGYSAGWTYKVITAGTYAGYVCEVGDLVIAVADYGTAFANSDWTVAQSNLEITSSVDTSSKVPTANAVKTFVEGKGYSTATLSKGTEANTTDTLAFGGTFTAMSETSVSGHTITDNTITYTLPSETALSTGTATSATGSTSHGGTFTAVTGIAVSGHKITPTVTTYTLPSDNNTDTKVTQTVTTTDAEYPILASATASRTATGTEGARFAAAVTLNPADGSLTATNFIGDLTGNADTATSATSATTATKLGSATVGAAAKPIYLNAGTATACSSTIGAAATPVYMSSGTITACSSTVGSGVKPVYMSSGTVTASTSTVGSGVKPVYMSSGAITVSGSTVGAAATPVFMSSGTITACTMATEDDITALFA